MLLNKGIFRVNDAALLLYHFLWLLTSPTIINIKSCVFVCVCVCGSCACQVLQNILEAESEFSRELQSLLGSYLRSLHPTDRYHRLSNPLLCFIQQTHTHTSDIVQIHILGSWISYESFSFLSSPVLQPQQRWYQSHSGESRRDLDLPADVGSVHGGAHKVSLSLLPTDDII